MFGDFQMHIINALQDLITSGGYLVLVIVAFTETFPFIGNILPGQTLMILAGWAAQIGTLDVVYVYFICLVSVLLGDVVAYMCGRKYGYGWLIRFGRYFGLDTLHFDRAKNALQDHVGKTLIFSRFTPVTRSFIGFLSGAGHIGFGTFMAYALLGAVIWIGCAVFGGYIFGAVVEQVLGYVGDGVTILLIAILVSSFFGYLLKKAHLTWKSSAGVSLVISAALSIVIGLVCWYLHDHPFTANVPFDITVTRAFFVDGFLANIALLITWVFKPIGAFIITLLIAGFWWNRFKKPLHSIAIILAGFAAPAISTVLKHIITRPRPEWSLDVYPGFSFPSNHVAFIAGLGIMIMFLVRLYKLSRLHYVWIVAIMVVVGWSRLALGHHYFFDVVFSYALGAAVACGVYGILRIVECWKRPRDLEIPAA